MQNTIIRYYYKEVRFLAKELSKSGLPKKLIKAVKAGDEDKFCEIVDEFQEDLHGPWAEICDFYEEYERDGCPEIFDEAGYKRFCYDPKEIAPDAIIVLLILSENSVTENDLFYDRKIFSDALEKYGYTEIVNYMKTISSIGDIQDIFGAYNKE